MKRIHLLRPGTFASTDGTQFTFSAANLAAIARNYDPQLGEAPLTVGHPKTDHPAFGWVERLEFDAGSQNLYAVPKQIAPEFADAVGRGAFKKISVALFAPDQAANPKPGDYYIRHVGFLGGHVPAIPGLSPVEFAAKDEAKVALEFAAPGAWSVATLFRRLRDYLISKDGLDAADQALPDYAVGDLEAAARLPDPDPDDSLTPPAPTFAAPAPELETMTQQTQAQLEADKAKLVADQARLDTERAALETQRTEFAAGARRAAVTADVDGAVAAGRVLPAERALLIEIAARLKEGETLQFAAADGSTQTVDLLAGWKRFLAALPPRVATGEFAAGVVPADGATFAAPAGRTVKSDRLDLHNRAVAWQKAHPGTEYLTAVQAVENT